MSYLFYFKRPFSRTCLTAAASSARHVFITTYSLQCDGQSHCRWQVSSRGQQLLTHLVSIYRPHDMADPGHQPHHMSDKPILYIPLYSSSLMCGWIVKCFIFLQILPAIAAYIFIFFKSYLVLYQT